MNVLYRTNKEHKLKVSRTAMELLEQIETYLAIQRMPPSRFGRLVASDPRLVMDLRSGRRPRRAVQARVEAYLSQESRLVDERGTAQSDFSIAFDGNEEA